MAFTRPDVNIPFGMIDIMVDLQRGNLVKAFSVVTVLSICEYHGELTYTLGL